MTRRGVRLALASLVAVFALLGLTAPAHADSGEGTYDDPPAAAQVNASGETLDLYRVRYINSPFSDQYIYLTPGPNGWGTQYTLKRGEAAYGKRMRSVWVSPSCPVDEYHVSVFTGKKTLRKHHTGTGWVNLMNPGVIKTYLERNCYGTSW